MAPAVTAAPGDIGFEGPSYAGSSSAPSGSKPESKLWFNDGIWWANLYSSSAGVFHIWRLDLGAQQWVDTGVAVDKKGTRADALWDGSKLYILSHVYSTAPATGNPMRLYRYSYSSTTKTYSLDSGFPATVSDYKTETAVFDKDSTGKLWATWVQNNQVVVTHTNGADNVWVTPFVLPATGTTVDSDDISSIIAFKKAGGTPRIGVMWSNQVDSKMHFAFHNDGAADSAWDDSAIALQGTKNADDHINLKSLDSDSSGRIFAVTKTSQTTASAPLIMLLTFTPSGSAGTWSATTVSRVQDGPTRPIVIIDQQAMQARVYMTGPVAPATTGDSGGKIVEKVSSLSNLGFPVGAGTTVMQDASSPAINNVSSTKQNVSSTTGLVLLAGNDTTDRYWWSYNALGGSPPPADPPVAAFTESPASGPAPLTVKFTDASTNAPTSWAWNFGDGGTSTQQSPSHTFTDPGTYTVTLVAQNGNGQDDVTNTVSVGPPLSVQTFTPTADSFTSQASPTKNYGTDVSLRVRNSTASFRSFVKFNVTGLSGTVNSVKLRLWVNDASANGGSVYPVSSSWTETGTGSITWNASPTLPASALKAVGPATGLGTWVEVDLGAGAIAGNGTVSFAIAGGSSDSAYYSSRNGTHPPELVIGTDSGGPPPPKPVADFSASPTNPTTGQTVQFTDASSNTPTSWDWDFGDGTTHANAQNPTHAYADPGQYTVTLVASNAGGASTPAPKTDYITVSAAPPQAPVAAFHALPTTGNAPLLVQFTDDSTNTPTSWVWDFNNDTSTDSTDQNPTFTYPAAGTYTVKLTATNAVGSNSLTKTGYITVGSGGTTTTTTFTATQDTRPNQGSPTSLTGGTDTVLRVRLDPTGAYHTLVRFNVTGLTGTVTSARLRLFCTDASPNGGTAYKTSGAWSEATTNWNNAPAATGPAAGTAGAVVIGAWAEFDVTSLVATNGQVDLLVQDGNSNSAYYSSREGANPPQLVVTTGP